MEGRSVNNGTESTTPVKTVDNTAIPDFKASRQSSSGAQFFSAQARTEPSAKKSSFEDSLRSANQPEPKAKEPKAKEPERKVDNNDAQIDVPSEQPQLETEEKVEQKEGSHEATQAAKANDQDAASSNKPTMPNGKSTVPSDKSTALTTKEAVPEENKHLILKEPKPQAVDTSKMPNKPVIKPVETEGTAHTQKAKPVTEGKPLAESKVATEKAPVLPETTQKAKPVQPEAKALEPSSKAKPVEGKVFAEVQSTEAKALDKPLAPPPKPAPKPEQTQTPDLSQLAAKVRGERMDAKQIAAAEAQKQEVAQVARTLASYAIGRGEGAPAAGVSAAAESSTAMPRQELQEMVMQRISSVLTNSKDIDKDKLNKQLKQHGTANAQIDNSMAMKPLTKESLAWGGPRGFVDKAAEHAGENRNARAGAEGQGRSQTMGREVEQLSAETSRTAARGSSSVGAAEGSGNTVSQAQVIPAVLQQLDRLRKNGKQWVRMSLSLDNGDQVTMQFRVNNKQLQVQFDSDSAELMSHIENGWADIAHSARERGFLLATPHFNGGEQEQRRSA